MGWRLNRLIFFLSILAVTPAFSIDYYKILGIEKTATKSQMYEAYRKKAVKYHPDKNPGDKEAAMNFRLAADAIDVLTDNDKRRRYDTYGEIPLNYPDPERDQKREADARAKSQSASATQKTSSRADYTYRENREKANRAWEEFKERFDREQAARKEAERKKRQEADPEYQWKKAQQKTRDAEAQRKREKEERENFVKARLEQALQAKSIAEFRAAVDGLERWETHKHENLLASHAGTLLVAALGNATPATKLEIVNFAHEYAKGNSAFNTASLYSIINALAKNSPTLKEKLAVADQVRKDRKKGELWQDADFYAMAAYRDIEREANQTNDPATAKAAGDRAQHFRDEYGDIHSDFRNHTGEPTAYSSAVSRFLDEELPEDRYSLIQDQANAIRAMKRAERAEWWKFAKEQFKAGAAISTVGAVVFAGSVGGEMLIGHNLFAAPGLISFGAILLGGFRAAIGLTRVPDHDRTTPVQARKAHQKFKGQLETAFGESCKRSYRKIL